MAEFELNLNMMFISEKKRKNEEKISMSSPTIEPKKIQLEDVENLHADTTPKPISHQECLVNPQPTEINVFKN
jgi:hypothetical protein